MYNKICSNQISIHRRNPGFSIRYTVKSSVTDRKPVGSDDDQRNKFIYLSVYPTEPILIDDITLSTLSFSSSLQWER